MKGAVTSMTRLEGKGSCGIMSFFSSGEAEAIGDKKAWLIQLGFKSQMSPPKVAIGKPQMAADLKALSAYIESHVTPLLKTL